MTRWWSAVAAGLFALTVYFGLASEQRAAGLAERLVTLERRAGLAEQQLRLLPPWPPCQVWVRSIHEAPLAARRCEEAAFPGIPGAKIEILNERAAYTTDEWGRAPIWRRSASVRVSAAGYLPVETRIENCGDDTSVALRPRNFMWPDPVVELPTYGRAPSEGVWP